MNTMIDSSLAALELAGALAPIPYIGAAAMIAQAVVQSCRQVRVHKVKAERLAMKCGQLLGALQDQGLEGTSMQDAVDQVVFALEKVRKKVSRSSQYTAIMSFVKNRDIDRELSDCESTIDAVMTTFHVSSHLALHRGQSEAIAIQRKTTAEMLDLLREIATNPQHRTEIAQVMATGQQELRHLREQINEDNPSLSTSSLSVRNVTERNNSRGDQILEFQRHLLALGIPPTVQNLNGEVTIENGMPVAGGPHSDVWLGTWLGGQKVAVKSLRTVQKSDRALQKFSHEIRVWSNLRHVNILPFYGLMTDFGRHISIVSQWQENGNLRHYVSVNPDANRLELLYGAAKGISYLHDESVVHGNVKCSNILVSSEGVASICDFGMSKIVEDVTETSVTVTLTQGGGMRWLAPELMSASVPHPTKPSDTYSFSMAILEALTLKSPFSNRRTDTQVILDVIGGAGLRPPRPRGADIDHWLSDDLWNLMQESWAHNAISRPTMGQVVERLEGIVIRIVEEPMEIE